MNILEKINNPQDLRIIKKELLPQVATEIRNEIVNVVSRTGGHLAGSLGAVEIIVGLHYVFNTPVDKIVFDVGHQAYAHKILTGRLKKFITLRQFGGLSGFPNIFESDFDAFSVGHSSTSISAALGMAIARDIKGEENKIIAVIGDGAITSGLAFEGLNNAGHLGKNLIVILNDNEMFISHKVGAIAGYLAKLLTLGTVKRFEKKAEKFLQRTVFWGMNLLKIAKRFKVLFFPGMLFEEMGFAYLGPIDGHNIVQLADILEKVKEMTGPVLLHVITKKGQGYDPAMKSPDKFHGIGRFNVITGETENTSKNPSYTSIFGNTLVKIAKENKKIVGITAAMSIGTGMEEFKKEFPERFFDVGIAEEHAVTFAAGLAKEGMIPVVAIYSTFLQRSFDQIIHDVCMQNLPVIFAIDRAGIVGEDGATHNGVFDISYLRMIPNLVFMAPMDENELIQMINTAVNLGKPVAIRYPRGEGIGAKIEKDLKDIPLGKSKIIFKGEKNWILSIGTITNRLFYAIQKLKNEKIDVGLCNMRFIKPLDMEFINEISKNAEKIITVEENVLSGGFGSAVKEAISDNKVLVKCIGLPDQFIEHGSIEEINNKYNLSAEKLYLELSRLLKT